MATLGVFATAAHVEHAVLSWLARYLKRDTSVQTGQRFEWLAPMPGGARRPTIR
jgi:hypothetical protein